MTRWSPSNAARTEEDLVNHFDQLIQTDPAAGWVIVLDNLNGPKIGVGPRSGSGFNY